MRRRGDDVVAYLHDVRTARPKRTATPAVLRALARALEARRTCPTCREVREYVIPRRFGECLHCAEPAGLARWIGGVGRYGGSQMGP